MIDRLIALFAFAVFLGFVGILAMGVPRLDLGLVIGLTVVLVAWDFIASGGKPKG
ncbi:hypothetical protein [Rhodovulum steppense]|uniref:Uncharacterized protein n=1 Tax=Rhodovulum steppense TaxID=540251 RepID=A0A4R1Z1I3_9RHOB|nr:hypothetical protein [Rhodovulum steppense]TCM87471.1 hypothetical protein EV216_10222 [Rhodovulum steppense]